MDHLPEITHNWVIQPAQQHSYFGSVEPHKIHDATLVPFVSDRLAKGASATTINRSLEILRVIINRSARAYRDNDGRPWLDGVPALITMLPECPRQPYPR